MPTCGGPAHAHIQHCKCTGLDTGSSASAHAERSALPNPGCRLSLRSTCRQLSWRDNMAQQPPVDGFLDVNSTPLLEQLVSSLQQQRQRQLRKLQQLSATLSSRLGSERELALRQQREEQRQRELALQRQQSHAANQQRMAEAEVRRGGERAGVRVVVYALALRTMHTLTHSHTPFNPPPTLYRPDDGRSWPPCSGRRRRCGVASSTGCRWAPSGRGRWRRSGRPQRCAVAHDGQSASSL